MEFVNRENEMEFMERQYKTTPSFVPIYGRRRIGKSRLIREFIRNKPLKIYYLASNQDTKLQINEFKQEILKVIPDEFLQNTFFHSWSSLFSYLQKIWPKNKKIILAIDEVTYIISEDRGFTSSLNKFWELCIERSKTMLILSGSVYSLMLKEVLSHQSPLYGRRTGQIHLQEFNFKEILKFTKNFSFEESIIIYGLLGGVAKYLEFLENYTSLEEFLEKEMLDPNGFFYEEALHYLEFEFKEPDTYISIIKALANQKTKINEIADYTGIENSKISAYINNLLKLRLIQKIIPISKDPKKFRGAQYRVSDKFLNFWYKIVSKYRSELNISIENIFEKVNHEINRYTGFVFEDITKEYLKIKHSEYEFGTFWDSYQKDGKNEAVEIDICGLDQKNKKIIFVECKFKEDIDPKPIFFDLKEKSSHVNWKKEQREEKFIIVAKSFKRKITECECIELKDLENYFR